MKFLLLLLAGRALASKKYRTYKPITRTFFITRQFNDDNNNALVLYVFLNKCKMQNVLCGSAKMAQPCGFRDSNYEFLATYYEFLATFNYEKLATYYEFLATYYERKKFFHNSVALYYEWCYNFS